jgi:hypothetical protein
LLGIFVAHNKSVFVSNQLESAKDLAETSMLFVSNWDNLANGFKLLIGDNMTINDKLFNPSSWTPSLKKV